MGNLRFKRISTLLAGATFLIAFLGLIGWAVDISFVRYMISKAFATINPLAGVNMLLFAVAFYLLSAVESSARNTWFAFALIAFIFSTSLSVMMDLLFGFSLHVDLLLPALKIEGQNSTRVHTHMAFIAALNFVLCSTSLWLTKKVPAKPFLHQALTLLVIIFSLFVVLGHLYGVPEFSLTLPLTMALPVAFCFILIALALLFSHPDVALTRKLTSSFSGSLATRYLIPSAVLLPLLIGYIKVWGHSKLTYSAELGTTLLVLSFIIIFITIVWKVTAELNRRDAQKIKQDEELLLLNKNLKDANEETATLVEELRSSNEELQASNEELSVMNENLDIANRTIAKQKDEQLNRVLDSSNDVIWSFDLTDKGENYLSRSAERIYGEPLEKLIERPRFWLEHIHPDDKPIKAASQYRLEKFGSTECTYRLELPTGIRWIHDRLSLIRNKEGKAVRLEGIAWDVTELKESERKLKVERNLLRSIIDNIPDNIFVVDLESRNLINNKSIWQMLGVANEEETLGKNAIHYLGERGRELIEDNNQIFSSGEPIINKEVIMTVAGKTRTTLSSKVPLRNENGKVIGLVGITRDITERVKQEEILNQYRKNLEIIFNNSSDNFLLLDSESKVVLFNKRFQQFAETFVGVTPEVGMNYYETIPVGRREENARNFEKAMSGEAVSTRGQVEKNGETYYFDIRFNPVVQEGVVTHVTMSALNVTEQRRHEILATRHRENLDIIFQNSTDFFILLNAKAEIVLFNKSFLDYTRDTVKKPVYLGMSYYDAIPSNRIATVKGLIVRCVAGENFTIVAEAIWPTGTKFFNVRYTPVLKNGAVTHISISSTDITEQKKQEIIANHYRANLDIIFSNTNDHFVLIEPNGKVISFNAIFSKFIQETLNFIPEAGMSFTDFVPPHRKEIAKELFERTLRGETISSESEMTMSRGKEYYELRYVPVINNGMVTHVCFSAINTTERKKQELVLNEYRANLEIIFSTTTDNFLLSDSSWNVVSFNRSFERFIKQAGGTTPVVGMQFLDTVAPQRKAIAKQLFERALKGEPVITEAEVTGVDGRKIWHLLRYEPIVKDGRITHVSISGVDISDLKIKERELQKSEANLKSMLDSTLEGFLLLDSENRVVAVNNSYNIMFSDFFGEMKAGDNILRSLPEKRQILLESYLQKVRKGEVVQYQVDYSKEVSGKYFSVTITPVITKQNEFFGCCVTAHDITAEMNAQKEIRKSEERYRALVENGLDVTTISNMNGEIIFCSGNLSKVLGYQDLSNYVEILHPDDIADLKHRQLFIYKNHALPVNYSMRLKHLDGTWRWIDATTMNLMHFESVKGIVTNFRDITERKLIEEELKRNQFFLEKASEAGKIGYWTSEPDLENGKLVWSKEVFNIFQINESEFDGRNETFYRLVHPDDRERVIELRRIAAEGNQVYNIDHRILLKNGQVRWVNERAHFIRNDKGEVQLWVGIVQDINDRKIIEQVLREYNDRHEILSRATNDIIWDWDIVNDKILYNEAMTTLMGYHDTQRNNTSKWREDRLHPEDLDRVMNEVKKVLKDHLLNWESSYRYLTASGDYKYIRDRAYVVYNKVGVPQRMIGAMQDVTELTEYRMNLEKKVEDRTRELNAALKKEKEVVEMRSKFVSIASHEFRTPLSTISLASGFVRKYKHRLTPDAIDEKLQRIETQVRHMSSLLDDILTIGKGEAGRIEVNLVTLPVRTLFENMANEVINSMRRSHKVNLQITFPLEIFLIDEGLIRNIVINLLSNAIKFSHNSNEVVLSVAGNKNEMIIGVRDYGIGIPPEDASKLFEPFYRGSNVSTISGTGLGLSIVRKAVDLLGGDIKVNSNVGRGTEFLVTLPVKS